MRRWIATLALLAFVVIITVGVLRRSHSPDWVFTSPHDIVAAAASDEGVVAVSTDSGILHILDAKGKLRASLSHAGWPTFLSLAFLPSGTIVAAGRDGEVVGVRGNKVAWTIYIGECDTSRLHHVDSEGNAWINRIVKAGGTEQVLVNEQGEIVRRIRLVGHHGYTPPTVAADGSFSYIYAAGLVGPDYAVDCEATLRVCNPDGQLLWETVGDFLPAYDRPLMLSNGNVIVGSSHFLSAYDKEGRLLRHDPALGGLNRTLAQTIDGRVIMADKFRLLALSNTGEVMAEQPVRDFLINSAVTSNSFTFCRASRGDWAKSATERREIDYLYCLILI